MKFNNFTFLCTLICVTNVFYSFDFFSFTSCKGLLKYLFIFISDLKTKKFVSCFILFYYFVMLCYVMLFCYFILLLFYFILLFYIVILFS